MISFNSECIDMDEASRGAEEQSVPTRGGDLYFHFFALVSKKSAVLSSATQHVMPPEFGRKWGTECLNTRFPTEKSREVSRGSGVEACDCKT